MKIGKLVVSIMILCCFACSEKKALETPKDTKEAKITPKETITNVPELMADIPEAMRPELPDGVQLVVVSEGEGKIAAPDPGNQDEETHSRHGWKFPEQGATGIVAVARWKDTSWGNVEFSIGTGICPHRGKQKEASKSASGDAVVHYQLEPDEDGTQEAWFLHVNADEGLASKGGETLEYEYRILAYR